MAQTLDDAQPGDLIEIFRGLNEEWAVYVGNKEVVYLTLREDECTGRQLIVKCDTIEKVRGSNPARVNNLLDKDCKPHDPDVIVEKARKMVGEEWSCPSISHVTEYFVRELRYGRVGQRQHKANPGDLIEIFRGTYQHWAVYVGEDHIVHLTNPGSSSCVGSRKIVCQVSGSGEVTRDNMWDVINTDHFEVNNFLDKECKPLDPDVILKKALNMVNTNQPYSVASCNCEHFATKLRYNKAVSRQVERTSGGTFPLFLWFLGGIIIAAAALLVRYFTHHG